MKHQLDETDKKLLALLMDDARLPVATLAKRIGIARTTAIARINNLEKRGVIGGYGVRLNQDPAQPAVCAYVGIAIDPHAAPGLVNVLQQWPEVETLCAVSGAMDYMLTLRCPSTVALDQLLDKIGMVPGVKQTSTSIILSRKIERRQI
ncbi:MAG: Lrp/AsnC family transcriptional regulator [Burkholderiales bacterium]|nr:Lrp/AsnC family transcriptional regulator [Burkholderiales bacterium]